MVLILSDAFDTSTTNVLEWLNFLGKKWTRINSQDSIELEFAGQDIVIKTDEKSIRLSEITSYWYRRGYFTVKNSYRTGVEQFDILQSKEFSKIIDFLHHRLSKVKHINSFSNQDVNKLISADTARSVGIHTPEDYLFSNAKNLLDHRTRSSEDFITKVISGDCVHSFDDFTIFNYTKNLNEEIDTDSFFPSLIQSKIQKKYELRIFYLDKKFYPMAIFSQRDNLTSVDFRNYNHDRPNRTVPFKLPDEIEQKLILLMEKLDLNCGSIDMVVTPNDDFVFLEVNPVGQFGMVSYPCNYGLERKIAEYL